MDSPQTCPDCGYKNAADALACGLCGVLWSPPDAAPASPAFTREAVRRSYRPPTRVLESPQRMGVPLGWWHLGVGIVLAMAFTLAPWLRFMGWLIGSLFHETGHVAFAWYVGCPAFPAVSLTGHAAAFHKPQDAIVLLLVGGLLGYAVWQTRHGGRFRALFLGLLFAWPLFAFVETARDLGFLLSGHLGELTVAGIFLWRARTGEDVESEASRPFYACLGWFLVVRNVALAGGLAFTESARAWYASSGSFGLTNDYARIAWHVLGVPLQAVAAFMLLVSAAVFPLVLAFAWKPPVPSFRLPPDAPGRPVAPPAARECSRDRPSVLRR